MSIWDEVKKLAGNDDLWRIVGKGVKTLKEDHKKVIDSFDVMKNSTLDPDKIYIDEDGNEIYYDDGVWRKRR